MFNSELSNEEIQEIIKNYTDNHGWGSFFGLIAQIAPQKVDAEDLKKNQEEVEREKTNPVVPEINLVHADKNINSGSLDISPASIYAEEHIPAVEEDYKEQGISLLSPEQEEVTSQARRRVLEQQTPNPWSDAKTVTPGELNL